jgi:hypothetical protein
VTTEGMEPEHRAEFERWLAGRDPLTLARTNEDAWDDDDGDVEEL